MKKAKPENEEILPFSFLKEDADNEKIKAHWQKIKEKINPELPAPEGNEDNE